MSSPRAAKSLASKKINASAVPLIRSPSVTVRTPEFMPMLSCKDEREEVRSMPEVAQLAIAVSAAAPIFKMRSFTLVEFEEALVFPHSNDLLNVILSRWLIRDNKIRSRLGPNEGMDPAWTARMLRETVRAWFCRAKEVRDRVCALLVACRDDADYLIGVADGMSDGEGGGGAGKGGGGGGDGQEGIAAGAGASDLVITPLLAPPDEAMDGTGTPNSLNAAAFARFPLLARARDFSDDTPYQDSQWVKESIVVKAAAYAIENAATLDTASDPTPLVSASASDGSHTLLTSLGTGTAQQQPTLKKPRSLREVSALISGVAAVAAATNMAAAAIAAQVAPGTAVMGAASGPFCNVSREDRLRAEAHGLGAPPLDGFYELARGAGVAGAGAGAGVAFTSSAATNPAWQRASALDAKGDIILSNFWSKTRGAGETTASRDAAVAAAAATSLRAGGEGPEADEDDVAELSYWEVLLEPLGWVPRDSAAALVAAATHGGAPVGTAACPLARVALFDLPLRERVLVLVALVEARLGAAAFLGGPDDVAVLAASAGGTGDESDDDGHDRDRRDGDEGEGENSKRPSAASRLRWRVLGAAGATKYLTFPAGAFDDDIRIYAETEVKLKSGRRTRAWAIAADDVASLERLRDAAIAAAKGGRAAAPVTLPPLREGTAPPPPVSAPDAALIASLKSLSLSASEAAARAGGRERRTAATAAAAIAAETRRADLAAAAAIGGGSIPLALGRAPRAASVAAAAATCAAARGTAFPSAAAALAALAPAPAPALAAPPAGFIDDGWTHPLTRPTLSSVGGAPHDVRVCAIADAVDADPSAVRFAGMPPTAAPTRPIAVNEAQRLVDDTRTAKEVEAQRAARATREKARRSREAAAKLPDGDAAADAVGVTAAVAAAATERDRRKRFRETRDYPESERLALNDPLTYGPSNLHLRIKIVATNKGDASAWLSDTVAYENSICIIALRAGAAAYSGPNFFAQNVLLPAPAPYRGTPRPPTSPMSPPPELGGGGEGGGEGASSAAAAPAVPFRSYLVDGKLPLRGGLDAARSHLVSPPPTVRPAARVPALASKDPAMLAYLADFKAQAAAATASVNPASLLWSPVSNAIPEPASLSGLHTAQQASARAIDTAEEGLVHAAAALSDAVARARWGGAMPVAAKAQMLALSPATTPSMHGGGAHTPLPCPSPLATVAVTTVSAGGGGAGTVSAAFDVILTAGTTTLGPIPAPSLAAPQASPPAAAVASAASVSSSTLP